MIRGWLMEKWLRGTFIIPPTSSSTIAVMPPRFQVTESMIKYFEVTTFWFTHYFLWPFAHRSALLFHTLASDPLAWFWNIMYPFSDLLLKLPNWISALYPSLISELALASRYSVRYYQVFLLCFTIIQNETKETSFRSQASPALPHPQLWEENTTTFFFIYIIC